MKQRSNCGSVHQGKYGMGTELLCPWYPLAGSVSTLFVRNLLASYLVSLTRSQKSHSQSHELLSAGGFALCIIFKDKALVVALIIKEVNSSTSSLVFCGSVIGFMSVALLWSWVFLIFLTHSIPFT